MILKTYIILSFNFMWLNSVLGASFSKVFVQSGSEIAPMEYIQYGVPTSSVSGSQFSQISAAPIGSVVPQSAASNYLAPCGTPCVYPASSVAAIQPATSNYVTYKSSVPVVVTTHDEPQKYEYSYVVYDENTGDHKSQREHSDGSVVRGEYSLIQPDGYVREVQYVADDIKGFNAIVKNFLPVNVGKEIDHKENKDPHGPPCHEVKNEPLKHTTHQEEKSTQESGEKSNEEVLNDKSKEESHESQAEKSAEHNHAEKSNEEGSHEKPSAALIATESHETKSEEEHKDVSHEGQAEPISPEEHTAEPTHEEHKAEQLEDSKESHEDHKQNSHEHKNSHESHEEPSDVHKESHELQLGHEPQGDVLILYNDVIKCVQSAIRKSNDVAVPHQAESPLTYIILNKPC